MSSHQLHLMRRATFYPSDISIIHMFSTQQQNAINAPEVWPLRNNFSILKFSLLFRQISAL
jgi:hypothetical protein